MDTERSSGLLTEKVTVLDLADEKGWFCAKLLADLGARVIRIEKPENNSKPQNDHHREELSRYVKVFWCGLRSGSAAG